MGNIKVYELSKCKDSNLELKALTIYACEGYKTYGYIAGVANSTPSIIRCYVDYLLDIGVPKQDIKIRVQYHEDLSQEVVSNYWKTLLPEIRYVGERRRKTTSKRNKLKYGIAHIEVCSKQLFDYILKEMSLIFPLC